MRNRCCAIRLIFLFCCAAPLFPSQRIVAQEIETPDPEEAEAWNAVWDEYSAFPLDVRHAPITELTTLPGVTDSLAINLRRTPFDRLPLSVREYVRSDAAYSANLRTRVSVRDPHRTEAYSDVAAYTRFSISAEDRWTGGVLVERDVGEPRLADHAAWTLAYQSDGGAFHAVGGQIGAHIGTGIIVGRSGPMWIDPTAIRMSNASIRPSLASVESGALVGGAVHTKTSVANVLIIVAQPKWDAVVDDSGVVTTIRGDGIHVSSGQRAARNQLHETFGAARLGFEPGYGTNVGITLATSTFDHPINVGSPRSPLRTSSRAIGFDGRILQTNGSLGGEIVRQTDGRLAATGLARYRAESVEFIVAGWSYDEDVFLPHGNGFSFRKDASGERAALVGVRTNNRDISMEIWTARYSQTYANSSDPFPRSGWIENAKINVEITPTVSLAARARHRGTSRPGISESNSRSEIRFTPILKTARTVVKPRFDYVHASSSGTGTLVGIYGAAETCSVRARGEIAAYRSTASNAALYLYDYRAPGYGFSRALYGTGVGWTTQIAYSWRSITCSASVGGVSRRERGTNQTATFQVSMKTR